jgi:hypothetical protein
MDFGFRLFYDWPARLTGEDETSERYPLIGNKSSLLYITVQQPSRLLVVRASSTFVGIV